MKTQTWLVVGALLAFGCSENVSEPHERTRGHGTFLVLGQPIEADYEAHGDTWTIFGDIGIDPETELLFEHEPGQVSELALKEGKNLKSKLWPNGVIPYRIRSNVGTKGTQTVKKAMQEWESKTAIQFVPMKDPKKPFVDIYVPDEVTYCSAQPGFTGGVRWMKLRANNDCNLGVVTHELGHTIGFMHEHQRTDRGKYVKLNMNCTSNPSAYAMLHSPNVFQFGSYDIKSTMHYRSSTLNSCGSTSAILAKDGSWLGHNWETLSAGDIAATAKMYGPKVDDQDSDGVADSKDNCKSASNESQLDTDGDGKGDACDADDDGDGIDDGPDNCSKKSNSSQLDTDKDGTGDACDSDDDGDKIVDSKDNCSKKSNPSQLDTDKDGEGNACDDDDDDDGVPDATDNCSLVSNANQADTDQDGTGNVCSDDNDGDGIVDGDDNCVNAANADQADADHDGKGDACETDTDSDGNGADGDEDGVPDVTDNCLTVPNPDQYDSNGAGVGDACPDSDGDGLHDGVDNCPSDANADQADGDQDGIGDACDDELDTPPDLPGYVPPDTKAAPVEETSSCQLVRSRGNGSSLALAFVALALGLGTRLIFRSRVRASGGLRPRLGRWRGARGMRRGGRFHRDPPRTSGEPGRCR
jgi:hypothetical protein